MHSEHIFIMSLTIHRTWA